MEFKFRSVDERPPPPPSPAGCYFSCYQPAFGGQIAMFRNPDMRLNLDPLHNPRSVHDEMIERQLEKERIREEIIAAEIVRRQALEAEVRRELMLEREIAMRRPSVEGLGFDQVRFGAVRFDQRVHHPFDDDQFGLFASLAPAAFDRGTWRRQQEPLTNGFKAIPAPPPVSDLNNKDKLILLAKPDPNLSGVRRKTPPTVGASELPPFGLKKKPKEEWSCALCHVSATSEKGLIHHINGKKHQAKEARLRAQKPGTSSSNSKLSKKAAKFSEPKEVNGIKSTKLRAKQVWKSVDHNETSDVSNQKMHKQGTSKGETPMSKVQCGEVLKNNDKVKIVDGVERKEDVKKQEFTFWCEGCKIGAFTPKVWSSHIRGKKHVARSQKLTQNNAPIASFMASTEACKEEEDSDAAKEAHEKIPIATPIASEGASKEAEDADADKEAHETFKGLMMKLMRMHNVAPAKQANDSAEVVADTEK
ncbi:hypothetical protein D8674_043028 [Pyrus ussuriensis x Pyrus communis]|uniref:U1-type domain-containing protein n=1 Tax=Pyrus ussuriensis x Pyrus communis TaxID=2448454 RepID=A0A5N5GUF1_9ROSA|nr:hypothetical protein D8674_043028 [Pyrus ussuriensis x Pyrus communis]